MREAFRWHLTCAPEHGAAVSCGIQRIKMALLDLELESGPVILRCARGDERRTRGDSAASARGIKRGDRVGVLRSQDAWTAAAHLAIWSLRCDFCSALYAVSRGTRSMRALADAGVSLIITDAERTPMRTMTAPALVPEGSASHWRATAKTSTIADTGNARRHPPA